MFQITINWSNEKLVYFWFEFAIFLVTLAVIVLFILKWYQRRTTATKLLVFFFSFYAPQYSTFPFGEPSSRTAKGAASVP